MERLKQLIVTAALVFGIGAFALPVPAGAINVFPTCSTTASSEVCGNSGEKVDSFLKTLINTLLFIVGAISVIVIIVGGISYTISAGDSSKITRAKNMVMYAVVGLVIAFLAYSIVNWVLKIV